MAEPAVWEEITWTRLAGLDPADVCRRSLAVQETPEAFVIPFLTTSYRVNLADRTIVGPVGIAEPEVQLVLLNYLIGASCTPPALKWVNERALSGGELFFNGPHALPVGRLCTRFATDPEGFLRGGTKLGGEPMEYGDASLRLQPLPRIPLVCILWVEDEEFSAGVSYLFDPTTDTHLALDAILGMVKCVGQELVAAADQP